MFLLSYGTRPEWLKIKPLLQKMENQLPFSILFTGQQTDIAPYKSGQRIDIKNGTNRLDSIVVSILNNDTIFEKITHVIVQGDTTSAFAVALAAFHRKIKVIHLEAGLRTHNENPYPEEKNRVLIDALSKIHLCPTEQNAKNLLNEGYNRKAIFVTGNTGLDNLKGINTSYGNQVIITMHRRENHLLMKEWFTAINQTALNNPDLKFIFPIHPNPNVIKHRDILTHIKVIPPVSHEEMVIMVANCRFLITDSGGLQEEAAFFNKKAIVCRDSTERDEVLDIHTFLCYNPDRLPSMINNIKNKYIPSTHYCPYGDGNSSEKILAILQVQNT